MQSPLKRLLANSSIAKKIKKVSILMAPALKNNYTAFSGICTFVLDDSIKDLVILNSFVARQPLPDSVKHLDGACLARSVIKEPFSYRSRWDSFAGKKVLNNLGREQNLITPRLYTCL